MTPPTAQAPLVPGADWGEARAESYRDSSDTVLDLYDLQAMDVAFILSVNFKGKGASIQPIPFCMHMHFPLYVA